MFVCLSYTFEKKRKPPAPCVLMCFRAYNAPPRPPSASQDESEAEENVVSLWVDDRDIGTPETPMPAVVRATADGGSVATALAAETVTATAGARAVVTKATMSRCQAGERSRRASFASVRAMMGRSRTVQTPKRPSSFSVRWVEGEAGGHRGSAPRLGERGLGLGNVRDKNDNGSDIEYSYHDDEDGDDDEKDDVDDSDDDDDSRGSGERVTGKFSPRGSCDGGDASVDGDVRRIGSRSASGSSSVNGFGGGDGGGYREGVNAMQYGAVAGSLMQIEGGHGSGGSGGGGGTCAGDRGRDRSAFVGVTEEDAGFFGGTAQLALRPEAMLSRALHPALAPPALPFLGGAYAAAANMSSSPRRAVIGAGPEGRYDIHRGGGGAELGCGSLDAGREGLRKIGAGEGRGGGDEEASVTAAATDPAMTTATAMENVAKALPPAMILETCLLAPLRKHCRLASSSCLGVFTEELGIARLVGGYRRGGERGDSVGRWGCWDVDLPPRGGWRWRDTRIFLRYMF